MGFQSYPIWRNRPCVRLHPRAYRQHPRHRPFSASHCACCRHSQPSAERECQSALAMCAGASAVPPRHMPRPWHLRAIAHHKWPSSPPSWPTSTLTAPNLLTTTSLVTGKVRPSTSSIALHRTPLSTSSPRSVMTRWATQPQRLAPYPFTFKFNYLSKDFLMLLPPPSDEHR